MKRILILIIVVMIAGTTYGQKKPKIGAAERARVDGNLGEAKEILDEAIVHEKTKDDGKTWYYRALLYASLDTTSNPAYKDLASDPLKTAMESFEKAIELNSGKSEYYITNEMGLPVLRSQQIEMLWGHYLNKGVEAYNAKDNLEAYKYFEKTAMVKPMDTVGYIYAAATAQAEENYDNALKNYYSLINDVDYHTPALYNSIIYIEGNINKDNEKALAAARKAKTKFPEDQTFVRAEINQLFKLDRVDEAKNGLLKAIENDSKNPDLYYTLGLIYEESKEVQKAKEAYQGSIDADPDYLNSRFNLAVLSYNEAIALIKEQNNLGISAADQKKAKAMESQIKAKLQEALPNWEKVHQLDPKDRTALETLQYIYNRLNNKAKYDEVSKKLDALG